MPLMPSIGEGLMHEYPVDGGSSLKPGDIVCVNAAGFAVPSADAAGLKKAVGIAETIADNTAGADGDIGIRVVSGRTFKLTGLALTQAMVGDVMNVETVNVVGPAAGTVNSVAVGVLVEFESATAGWVYIPVGGMEAFS